MIAISSHTQADETASVVIRLRFDHFERRLHRYRRPAVQGVQQTLGCGDAPPIPVTPFVVRSVPSAQCKAEVGRVGEPPARLCPGTTAALIGLASRPAPSEAQAAGHAAVVGQTCESDVGGSRDVVPVRTLVELRCDGRSEHEAPVESSTPTPEDALASSSSRKGTPPIRTSSRSERLVSGSIKAERDPK